MIKNTYGTGCFLLLNTGPRAVASSRGLLTTVAWKIGGETVYALEGSVFIAGAAIQWLRDGLRALRDAAESQRIAESVRDTGGVRGSPSCESASGIVRAPFRGPRRRSETDRRLDARSGMARTDGRGSRDRTCRPSAWTWLVVVLLIAAPAQAQRVERYPEQFGPFTLGKEPGQRVTVTAVYQRLLDAKEYWRATTLEYWSIQNETRTILARGRESTRTQPPGEFVEAKGLSAYLLEGRGRPMLLLVFGVVPSTPTSGVTYEIWGVDRSGAFRQALVLQPYGEGVMNPIGSQSGKIALAEGRYLDVSEWLGSFAMRIRYEYDEASHRFTPRNSCSPPLNPLFDREGLRQALERGGDPRVEMHETPKPGAQRRVARLTEKSRVKLIEACTGRFGPGKVHDLWLKVIVDGNAGWVVESEFHKLGLGAGD
jgi:hypothetical protein